MQQFTGKQYLMIDIANNFGLDKKLWDERMKWYEDNQYQLDQLVNKAAEPALYFAGVQAMKKVEQKQPIGYGISLDATSSGLQILAAITCDEKAARLCNVINTGNREDAYVNLFHIMKNNMLKIDAGQAGNLKREDLKDAIMTSLYGSEAIPKLVFGEGAQLRCFYHTMEEEAPLAWQLNQAFLAMWNPEATEYNWVLPDNFHVKTKVMDTETEVVHFNNNKYDIHTKVNRAKEKGRSLGANTIHSLDGMIVREISRRCDYDVLQIANVRNFCTHIKNGSIVMGQLLDDADAAMVKLLWSHYQETGYLSARILDHLYAHNSSLINVNDILDLIDSMPAKPFKVISVHDCFRCLPTYGNDLRKQYNLQLALLAKSEILSSLISQIIGKPFKAPKGNPNMWKDILDADYALS